MGDKTAIEWADATWNPIRGVKGTWSCVKVSPGCQYCYAERLNVRRGGPEYKVGADDLRLDEEILTQPLRWKRPRRIFVCSMTDLFEERVPDEWIARIFDVMTQCNGRYVDSPSRHIFQVLTKRAERMCRFMERFIAARGTDWLSDHGSRIWLGVSVENQATADERIPWLLKTPAAVRFLSVEPLLGPIDLRLGSLDSYGSPVTSVAYRWEHLHWVIVGGESGGPPERALVAYGALGASLGGPQVAPNYFVKPEALEWVRSLRDQCQAAGVPFFFKAWGGPTSKSAGRLLDGKEWSEYPNQTQAVHV